MRVESGFGRCEALRSATVTPRFLGPHALHPGALWLAAAAPAVATLLLLARMAA